MGDYGKLDEVTGEFYAEGNIYKDMHIYQDEKMLESIKLYPPVSATPEDVYIAASTRVKRNDLTLGAEL